MIESLDSSLSSVSKSLHDFLLNINERISIGIPVGPAASIVLAEAILLDLDNYILRNFSKVEHTRYVDDFRVFAKSKTELLDLWNDLARYMYNTHRLTLANDKSRVMESSKFRETVLYPASLQSRKKQAEILGIAIDEFIQISSNVKMKKAQSTKATFDEKNWH